MRSTLAAIAAAMLLLSGCATQKPVAFSLSALKAQPVRVGVVLAAVPKPDTQFPGAGCLLCLAAAAVVNQSLTSYAGTLTTDELTTLPADIARQLQAKGIDARAIDERVKLDTLPSARGGAGLATRDFSSLGTRYGIDKLVVIEIALIGFERTYAQYIPTSEPKGFLYGKGYLVDLKTQAYEWYENVRLVKAADGPWDEPPKFPGLTNAFYQALELGKDCFVGAFGEEGAR